MNDDHNPIEETLPYGSAATFVTTLDHLREVGIPNIIDRNTLPQSFSGSSRYEVLGALKFFKLIDKDGHPNVQALEPLLAEKSRKGAMTTLLESAYASLFALPLSKAGPGQIQKWFSEHASPSKVGKSKAFFIALAKQNGIAMHTMVAKGARVVTGSVKRKRRTKKDGANADSSANGGGVDTGSLDQKYGRLHPAIQAWIDELPDSGSKWNETDFKEWLTLLEGSIRRAYKLKKPE